MLRFPPKPPTPPLFSYPIPPSSPPPTHHSGPSMNRPDPNPQRHGGAGGREECWSDGATDTLILAWGDRYVQLNRGNLRQKDWMEVAGAVNAGHDGVKPPKTFVQCKNRVDTLKKKYKVEKSKPAPSKWVFYHRVHSLIGANAVVDKKTTTTTTTTVTLTVKSSAAKPDPSPIRWSAPASYPGGYLESSLRDNMGFGGRAVKKQRFGTMEFSDGAGFRELARAIVKFGEIYERIERWKQQQMMELEKQRMEFTRDLEFQRMNMFMDAQLNNATNSGKKK